MSPSDKLAYIRKHRPSPVAAGSGPGDNIPPLFDSNLEPDKARDYWVRYTKVGYGRAVVVLKAKESFDLSDYYQLAIIGQDHPLPGVPTEKVLLKALDELPKMP